MSDGQHNSDDRLSAWFDHELAASERAEIEQALNSADAQQELADFGRLGELLRDLPRQNAPAELASSVMQRIERESLLVPAAAGTEASFRAAAPAAAPTIPMKSQSRRRRLWWLGSAVTVAAAASILVAVQLSDVPDQDLPEAEGRVAVNEAAPMSEPEGVAVADRDDFVREKAAVVPKSGVARREFKEAPVAAAAPLAGEPGADAPAEVGGEFFQQGAGLGGGIATLEPEDVDWGALEIGDVIPYLENSGDRVAVIDVVVVDVEKALGTFQVLLAKNRVAPVQTDEARGVDSERREPESIAVYVESTPEQVRDAIEDLRGNELFVDLKLQPPTQLGTVIVSNSFDASSSQVKLAKEQAVLGEIVAQVKQSNAANAARMAEPVPEQHRARVADPIESSVPAFGAPAIAGVQSLAATEADESVAAPVPRPELAEQEAAPLTYSLARNAEAFQMKVNVADSGVAQPQRQMAQESLAASQTRALAFTDPNPAVRVMFVFQGSMPPAAGPP